MLVSTRRAKGGWVNQDEPAVTNFTEKSYCCMFQLFLTYECEKNLLFTWIVRFEQFFVLIKNEERNFCLC